MRQSADGELVPRLSHLRNGTVGTEHLEEDHPFWLSRRLRFLPKRERAQLWSLKDCHTIIGTCYNKDRDSINEDYVRLFDEVYLVKSINKGSHAIKKDHRSTGMLKSIPRVSYLAISMMVKLHRQHCSGAWVE